MTPGFTRTWRGFICSCGAMTVAGCSHGPVIRPEPIITPVEVAVPVAVSCVPSNVASAPDYPDTDTALKAAADAAVRYQLLYAGRKVRTARLNELEPIVGGCTKAVSK